MRGAVPPSAKAEPDLGVTLNVAGLEVMASVPSVFLSVTLVVALVTVPASSVDPALARSNVTSLEIAVPL